MLSSENVLNELILLLRKQSRLNTGLANIEPVGSGRTDMWTELYGSFVDKDTRLRDGKG